MIISRYIRFFIHSRDLFIYLLKVGETLQKRINEDTSFTAGWGDTMDHRGYGTQTTAYHVQSCIVLWP
jgi:hypothetical protein